MKKYVLIMFLMLLPAILQAQDILNQYLKEAAENNPALKAKFKKYLASAEKAPQVGSLPDPTVAFGYFINPVETRVGPQQGRISLFQKFPWFGELQAREDHMAYLANARFQEFEQMRTELFYDVKKAWYDLFLIEEEIKLIEDQIEYFETFRDVADTKYQAGIANFSDLIRIDMSIDRLNARRETVIDIRQPLTEKFNKLLNRQGGTDVIVTDSIDSVPMEYENSIIDSIYKANPQLKSLRSQTEASLSAIKAEKKKRYPDFGLGLDYVFVGQRQDMQVDGSGKDAIMPKLSLSIPVYREKYNAAVREQNYLLESTQNMIIDRKNELRRELADAIKEHETAMTDIELNRSLINQAETAYRALLSVYSTEGSEFDQLLSLQEDILKYRFKLEKAKVQQNLAVATIEKLLNKEL